MPPFASWQGSGLPYPALLLAQLLIIAWFVRTAWQFSKGEARPDRRRGFFFLVFGSLYFLTMLARLLLGMTVYRQSRWFTSYLPTAFHLVLASWILLYGHFNYKYGSRLPAA